MLRSETVNIVLLRKITLTRMYTSNISVCLGEVTIFYQTLFKTDEVLHKTLFNRILSAIINNSVVKL